MSIKSIIAVGAMLAAMPGTASALDINLGHTLTVDSHYQAAAQKFKEVLEAGSKGEITVSIFPQSQLGGEVKMIQGARTGTIGAFITAAPPVENTVPQFAVFSLPYLFDSVEQANGVLQSEVGRSFLDELPAAGLVGLDFFSVFERSVGGNRAIDKVEDMRGMKIRVLQGPGFIQTYDALGAQATPMAYSEVFVALQNGVVDGLETSPEQAIQDKFSEIIKNFSLTKIHLMPSLLVMSKPIYDQLTPEQQALVRDASHQAVQASIDTYAKTRADALVEMKELGIAINEPDLDAFKKTAREQWPALLASVPDGQANLDMIQAANAK